MEAFLGFTRSEVLELLKSMFFVTLVFTIASSRNDLGSPAYVALVFGVFFLCAGAGFILHEAAHKLVAQTRGLKATYFASGDMSAFSVLAALGGYIILAPGAVSISGHGLKKKDMCLISISGPFTNLVVAFLFYALTFLGGFTAVVGAMGYRLNAWLALFNMVPAGIFDGAKVFKACKPVYLLFSGFCAYLVFFAPI